MPSHASRLIRRTTLASALTLLCLVVSATQAWAVPTPQAHDDPGLLAIAEKVVPAGGAADDMFGQAVAVSGDWAIVGAPKREVQAGAARVYRRTGSTWTQEATLTAPVEAAGDWLGASVAISGDTAVVGASGRGGGLGVAYVFRRIGNAWTREATLTASGGVVGDAFGSAVAVSGNTIVVGAIGAQGNVAISGAAYVFTRSGATWSQEATLAPSDGVAYDYFGYSVALDGDSAVIGAYEHDAKGLYSGAAYVFSRSGSTWSQQQELTASNGVSGDVFGWSVALSGDTAVVGAIGASPYGEESGSAYVFKRSAATWAQEATLTASDGAAYDNFGYSVAASGDRILVGGRLNSSPENQSGSAYLYTRSGSAWTEQPKITAPDGAATQFFGWAVALSGDNAVVGAPGDTTDGPTSGAAYFLTSSYGVPEGEQLVVSADDGVLGNDTPEGSVAATQPTSPAHGDVVLAADGSFTYTPDAGWYGSDAFTYRAYDGYTLSAPATVKVTVTPVNHAPVAVADAASGAQDTSLTVAAPGVLGNDTDADGDALTADLVAGPAHGVLELHADGGYTYRPSAGWHGSDTFTYRAYDGTAYSAPALVALTINAPPSPPIVAPPAPVLKVTTPTKVKRNKNFYITGTITPTHTASATKVALSIQRYYKRKWRVVKKVTVVGTSGSGAFKYKAKLSPAGSWRVVATHGADSEHTGTATATRKFTVR